MYGAHLSKGIASGGRARSGGPFKLEAGTRGAGLIRVDDAPKQESRTEERELTPLARGDDAEQGHARVCGGAGSPPTLFQSTSTAEQAGSKEAMRLERCVPGKSFASGHDGRWWGERDLCGMVVDGGETLGRRSSEEGGRQLTGWTWQGGRVKVERCEPIKPLGSH